MKCILALDQGTTSSRSILFDGEGRVRAVAQKEFSQHYPRPGWVEHDPEEIWETQQFTAKQAITDIGADCEDIEAIGIANQRETTVVWNRSTGKPIYNAIVWQDRRTAGICRKFRDAGLESLIHEKTGLQLDPYFSATKLKWILDHVDGARVQAERGELAAGTIDTWLMWKLTQGSRHVTDVSNASRTLLFNIHTLDWDDELLQLFDIPRALLPEVGPSSGPAGETGKQFCVPGCRIGGIAGDQQAALFGQGCFEIGEAKNTYGTGCFLLMNIGEKPSFSRNRLLTTVAWEVDDAIRYAMEGSVFAGGAVVQWLRDEMELIQTAAEIEALAGSVPDTGGVYLVPAFAGLGSPHWDPHARGTITGLTRGSTKAHIARAALEAMCFQSMEVLRAMEKDSDLPMKELRVDGGACANNLLMQIQADLLQVPVLRPRQIETTAFGAAALAGLAVDFWQNPGQMKAAQKIERVFEPQISAGEAEARYTDWMKAVERSKAWDQ